MVDLTLILYVEIGLSRSCLKRGLNNCHCYLSLSEMFVEAQVWAFNVITA